MAGCVTHCHCSHWFSSFYGLIGTHTIFITSLSLSLTLYLAPRTLNWKEIIVRVLVDFCFVLSGKNHVIELLLFSVFLCTFAIYLEFSRFFFVVVGICQLVSILWIIIIILRLSLSLTYPSYQISHFTTVHNHWSDEQGIHAVFAPFFKLSLYCNHYMCIIYLLFWWWLLVVHLSHFISYYCYSLCAYGISLQSNILPHSLFVFVHCIPTVYQCV